MRKLYINYLRVLAILAVITIHVTSGFFRQFGLIDLSGWWLANILNASARFSVPLFVMISGAVLLGRKITTIDFYKKRIGRLIPALIFWNLLYIFFNIFKGMTIDGLLWNLKIGYFSAGKTEGHLWYLTMYMCLMLYAPFINKFLIGEKPLKIDIFIILMISFVFFLINGISEISDSIIDLKIEWHRKFPWYIIYFIAGYYIDIYSVNIKKYNLILIIMSIIFIGCFINYNLANYYGIFEDAHILLNTGAFIFLISLSIFAYAKKISKDLKDIKIINDISDASFGIYLIHPIYIYFINHHLEVYSLCPLIYIPLSLLMTFILSFYTIKFIRKIKFIRNVT